MSWILAQAGTSDKEPTLRLAAIPPISEDAAATVDQTASGKTPNGLAFASNGDILVADIGAGTVDRLTRDGTLVTVIDSIDGVPLGRANYLLRDSKDRLWLTVSTRADSWIEASKPGVADGYLAVIDDAGIRIVADGFGFANEVKLDANEEWLYVSETFGKKVTRMRLRADGTLGDRETFGPDHLGLGFPDGITFDAFGNLWVTMVFGDRLIALAPDGEVLELLDETSEGTRALEAEFNRGDGLTLDTLDGSGGKIAPWTTSVTFGGPDLRTAYLGSLKGTSLAAFSSPVPGLAPVHW